MYFDIFSDIRNKLQALSLVLERMVDGKTVPESFLKLAIRDFIEAWKLSRTLPKGGAFLG